MSLTTKYSKTSTKLAIGDTYNVYYQPPVSLSSHGKGLVPRKRAPKKKVTEERQMWFDADESFTPALVKKDRNCFYISGQSGAGKSHLAAQLMATYHKKYPDNHIFIIQPRDIPDPAFKEVYKFKKLDGEPCCIVIPIDSIPEALASGMTYSYDDFASSCVCFDDFQSVKDLESRAYLEGMKKEFLELGRKNKITVICTTHHLADGKKTYDMIHESNGIVVFPLKAGGNELGFFKSHMKMSQDEIDEIMNLPSYGARWVFIGNEPIRYVLWSHGAYLL